MGLTHFPHGIMATPTVGAALGFGWHKNSKPIFVDGDNGGDGRNGSSPDESVETITKAISLAGTHDVIYIAPRTWTTLAYSYPGLNTAYAESTTIPYAKAGLAIVGIGHQGMSGIPHDVVIRETASATTANMTCNAPMCAFENLCFERGGTETAGQLRFRGGTTLTYEGNAASVYNCYFYYANGTTGYSSAWGGAVIADQTWGLTVQKCYFLGCRIGILFTSGGATAGSFIASHNTFASRNMTASEIAADIVVYTQGAACLSITDNDCAHLIPSLSGGDFLRYIYVIADVRQGLITRNSVGAVQGTPLTVGSAGTGIICPDNVGHGCNWCNGALMAEAT